MKRVFAIHGWSGSDKDSTLVWLKDKLAYSELKINILEMPNPQSPKVKEWLRRIKSQVGTPDKETFFIGYSFGCLAIMRYVETINVKIGGMLFVAPWIHMDKETIKEEGEEAVELAKPWMEPVIDWGKIKSHAGKVICIFSDNDPFVPLSESKTYSEKLGAKIIIEKDKDHFDQPLPEIELHSAITSLEEISK